MERLVGWMLDPDGVMYGDEQERLRYYESSTVVASLHGILLPWALAVIVWVYGRPVATPVLILTLLVFLPFVVGGVYLKRQRVRMPTRITGVWLASAVLSLLPYPVVLLGLARAYSDGPRSGVQGGLVGGLIGAAVGVLAGAIARFVTERRRARLPVQDDDEDDL